MTPLRRQLERLVVRDRRIGYDVNAALAAAGLARAATPADALGVRSAG